MKTTKLKASAWDSRGNFILGSAVVLLDTLFGALQSFYASGYYLFFKVHGGQKNKSGI